MIRYIDEPGIISPRGDTSEITATVAITAFSDYIFDELLRCTGAKLCGCITGGVEIPLYAFCPQGKNILIYKTPIGAPAAASAMEEAVAAAGVEDVIAFGICGALTDIPPHRLIVPTRAYRDEGTSYHYAPESEYFDVPNASVVAASLQASGIPVLQGGVWTTDGFYRETRTRADEMRAAGCIAVDMECSALQAVANFRGKQFYTFFITADSLAGEEWEPNYILDLKVTDSTTAAVAAAITLAKQLVNK